MVKLSILFRHPADLNAFEVGYADCLGFLEQMPGIQRQQACMVIGSPAGRSPYYRILEFYFADSDTLDRALRSPQGQAAGSRLMGFARDSELIFAEVYEE